MTVFNSTNRSAEKKKKKNATLNWNDRKKSEENGKIAIWKMPEQNRRMIQQNTFFCVVFLFCTMNIYFTKDTPLHGRHGLEKNMSTLRKSLINISQFIDGAWCSIEYQIFQWHLFIAWWHLIVMRNPADAIDHRHRG